ncbi:MAG: hypothetical protein LBQ95_06390 [Lachnospiraceae bacterium]|jgi:xylulokinase|nr:hypothetical protein [Lachnospiraceae bacterium]
MGKELLLAIDIGTTNLKGALFSVDGKVIAAASRRHQVSRRFEGYAEHDAEGIWWREFCDICAELLKSDGIEAKDIISVAFSSLSPALLPVDADGKALYPAILYGLDKRAVPEIKELNDEFREYCGGGDAAGELSTGPKILWLYRNEPEIFKKAAYFVGAPSFMVYRLTGEMVADYGCYRIGRLPFNNAILDWDDKMCEACKITRDKLPRLMYATERAGLITKEAAALTGLIEGTPVAVGTGDFLAEKLSFGTKFNSTIQFTFGTTVGIDFGNDFCTILFPDFDPNNQKKTIRGGAMSNGCSTIDWVISLISGIDSKRVDDDKLNELLELCAPGANGIIILPYLNGEKNPMVDPDAKGMIFGLQARHTAADLYRASLESLAYSMRHMLTERAPNLEIKEAAVMGGGVKIPGLLQAVSDVTGFNLTKLETVTGTLVGGAFIAGMACGLFNKREDIDSWIKVADYITPRPEFAEIYERGFDKYRKLYESTKDIMHES